MDRQASHMHASQTRIFLKNKNAATIINQLLFLIYKILRIIYSLNIPILNLEFNLYARVMN
jgi:hypothetical protein